MKLKHIYGASILFLLMLNCAKDEEPSNCYLISATHDGAHSDLYYFYTNDTLTSFMYGTADYTVEYDNLDRISTISFGYSVQSFAYNDRNQIISISFLTRLLGASALDSKTDYSYNSYGQLSQTQEYDRISNGVVVLTGGKLYQYPNSTTHNPSVISSASTSTTYSYDNKYNPFTALKAIDPTIPTNNVTKETDTTTSTVRTFSYIYNSAGYPLSQTVETSSSTIKETTTFSYSNCN